MRLKIIVTFVIVLALAVVASAQTKTSGTAQCAKPDQEHSIQVGDRPNYSFAISQERCTWTKPLEIAGIQNKDGVGTHFAEIRGNTSRGRGYFVDTMANGDKGYYRGETTGTLKDGVPQSAEGKWTLVGGTGKLKGVKGNVTCRLKEAQAEGGYTADCEGEYELPK